MKALRIVGRGLRDTYEHLFAYVLASIGWWVSVMLVVTLPGGTSTLFMLTDPRRAIDRPDLGETFGYFRANLLQSWKLALVTLPIPVVLFLNLVNYAGTSNWLAVLTPLWVLLLVVSLVLLLLAFSAMGLLPAGIGRTLKRAAYVGAISPVRTLLVFLVLLVISAIGALAVVPLILLVPAVIAATLNRLLLDGLQIPVVDPSAPTDEREQERRSGVGDTKRRWWGGS